jgi:hypothetical protein
MHVTRNRDGVRARLVVLVGAIALLGWGQQLTGPPVVSAASCVDGWRPMPATTTIAASPGGAASLAGVPAWWVGRSGAKTPQILRWKNGAWRGVTSPWSTEGSLLGVSALTTSSAWAVGYLHGLSPRPISAHWDGVSWKAVSVPAPAGWTTLTDVVALSNGTAWAVGTRLYQGRDQPVAMRWNGTSWIQASPSLGAKQEAGLIALATTPAGAVYAAGWRSTNGRSAPWIGRWDGSAWTALPLPDVGGLGYLTEIRLPSSTSGWAVGYIQRSDGSYAPLLMRWDGVNWTLANAPWNADSSVVLTAASVTATGVLVVGGNQMGNVGPQAVVATRRAGTWQVGAARHDPFPGSWVTDAAPVSGGAWIAAAQTTTPQAAFASAYISCSTSTTGALPNAAPPSGPGVVSPTTSDDGDAPQVDTNSPSSLAAIPAVSAESVSITARDKTDASGIAMTTRAFSGVVADFNNDGWSDVFINRHTSGVPLLELGSPDGFSTATGTTFGVGDFFNCAAADVDGNDKLDLLCPTGRRRGTFFGVDEFRLDIGSTGGTVATKAYGLLDATGRGRSAAFVHLAGDELPDLFVGTEPVRMDGLPTFNRFYRNVDGTHFRPEPEAGLDASVGGYCAIAADLDGDGNDEVLVCGQQASASGLARGARVYSYNGTAFEDKTAALGIRPMSDVSLQVGDFNGDGKLDIAQLRSGHLRVSLKRATGAFSASYDLALEGAVAMAVGDVNGDSVADVYVRGNRSHLMLVNDGDGSSFTSIALPAIKAGSAADVVAIDYDHNGLTDFLSLNGEYSAGPLQLIAFFPEP